MFLFYVYVQGPACVYCLVPAEARRRHSIPWTEITGGCGPPCQFGEPNLGLLQEQEVLLSAEYIVKFF